MSSSSRHEEFDKDRVELGLELRPFSWSRVDAPVSIKWTAGPTTKPSKTIFTHENHALHVIPLLIIPYISSKVTLMFSVVQTGKTVI